MRKEEAGWSLRTLNLRVEGIARIGMCMGHRCIMLSRRKRRTEAMGMQNAQVIVSWQKKLILGVVLPRCV
jgi:hypothetical protein